MPAWRHKWDQAFQFLRTDYYLGKSKRNRYIKINTAYFEKARGHLGKAETVSWTMSKVVT